MSDSHNDCINGSEKVDLATECSAICSMFWCIVQHLRWLDLITSLSISKTSQKWALLPVEYIVCRLTNTSIYSITEQHSLFLASSALSFLIRTGLIGFTMSRLTNFVDTFRSPLFSGRAKSNKAMTQDHCLQSTCHFGHSVSNAFRCSMMTKFIMDSSFDSSWVSWLARFGLALILSLHSLRGLQQNRYQ